MDRAAYEQFAELEEDHFWFRGRRAIFRSVLSRLGPAREGPLRCLEIGSGAGGLLRVLAEFGPAPVGVEIDEGLATLSKERSDGTHTIRGDAYRLPVRSDCRDVVALFDTIEHLEDEDSALLEALRVLRPGGVLMISVPAYQWLYANNDRVAHHCRRYTRRRLRRVVESNGFTARRVSYFNTLLFPAIVPAVLLGKLKDRLGRLDPDATNLSNPPSPLINRVLTAVMSSERHVVSRMTVPVGHSIVGVWVKD